MSDSVPVAWGISLPLLLTHCWYGGDSGKLLFLGGFFFLLHFLDLKI